MLRRTSLSSILASGGAIVFIGACAAPQRQTSYQASLAQQEPGGAADQPQLTQGLAEIVALRPYDFRAYFDRQYATQAYRITGDDLVSLYSNRKQDGQLLLSGDIPNQKGEYVYKGMFWNTPTLGISGRRVDRPVTNGYTWTPRTETAGGVNLATREPVSRLPGFDFDSLKRHPAVIHFANGYGVNLYGAVILEGAIIQAGSDHTYVTSNGEKLYGRVIQERREGGVRVLHETILE